MDSGTGASSWSRDPARHARFPRGHAAAPSMPSVPALHTRRSMKCFSPPQPPRLDGVGLDPQIRSWADLPADILGVVVCRLPRFGDRASVRSVCRAWRAAALFHRPPPPPLPLLVLADFVFASFCADGTMAPGARRIPLSAGVSAAHDVRCVGSFEGWLVAVQLNKGRSGTLVTPGAC
jgi:hypothetical protein